MESPVELMLSGDIDEQVEEIAARISEDYADTGGLVLTGVLKGLFHLSRDLARRLLRHHRDQCQPRRGSGLG